MNKLITELIGTFFLVLVIGLVRGEFAPIAIGAVLMVMVFAGGHISGAHYNPAITMALAMRGKCSWKDAVLYWVFQFIGAAAAAGAVSFISPVVRISVDKFISPGPPIIVEFLFTFALAWVVLNVATAKRNDGNSFYGLAIGATVMAGIFTVGGISGAVFNPAVGVATALMGMIHPGNLWIYFVATFLGAILATLVFKTVIGKEEN
ncbi:MAG: porin [Verrucomicrobiales bacterium]|nr:porin [Verrucomicrobiales bacterium]